ncbi:GGDEF domain-containing response regulator [Sesbania bispinosa]|nr:GGDEF domain-containing response regulator [Sesbania bispinosa]
MAANRSIQKSSRAILFSNSIVATQPPHPTRPLPRISQDISCHHLHPCSSSTVPSCGSTCRHAHNSFAQPSEHPSLTIFLTSLLGLAFVSLFWK